MERQPRETDKMIGWTDPEPNNWPKPIAGTYNRLPWHYSGMGEVWCHSQDRPICQTRNFLTDEYSEAAEAWGTYDADGFLIAAVPELYDVAQRLIAIIQEGSMEITPELVNLAGYAVRKAHGQHFCSQSDKAQRDISLRYKPE